MSHWVKYIVHGIIPKVDHSQKKVHFAELEGKKYSHYHVILFDTPVMGASLVNCLPFKLENSTYLSWLAMPLIACSGDGFDRHLIYCSYNEIGITEAQYMHISSINYFLHLCSPDQKNDLLWTVTI